MSDLSGWELAYCATAIFLAYGLRGSTGFGGAVGMPLLALVLPIKVLVPAWTLLGFTSSIAILGRDRRHVDRRVFVAFIPWCMVGIAIGLYLFKTLDPRMLARGLGVLIMSYGAYSAWAAFRPSAAGFRVPRGFAPVASILSGAVGALFGTMGTVFFALYLDAHALRKDQFRATISAMLLTLSAVRGIGYFAVGEFTREAWLLFAAAFPVMLAGIYVGDRIQLKLSEQTFRRAVCVTLFLCGIPLLLK